MRWHLFSMGLVVAFNKMHYHTSILRCLEPEDRDGVREEDGSMRASLPHAARLVRYLKGKVAMR
jgi:hypothetical protein